MSKKTPTLSDLLKSCCYYGDTTLKDILFTAADEIASLKSRILDLERDGERLDWKPIETLDRTKMQFILVTEDGAVRLSLWNPRTGFECACSVGKCRHPTHWAPCPLTPNESAAIVTQKDL